MNDAVFLGTGAAELYPNPFCGCAVCERARRSNETRLRSCFLLDEKTMIDFGPDAAAASQHYHVPLNHVEHVLITHTHEDHFSDATFSILTMTTLQKPIHFYLSEPGMSWIKTIMTETNHLPGTFGHILTTLTARGSVIFHTISPYKTYDIGGKKVTPLVTNHAGYGEEETAQNYLFSWKRGTWLYACDTGLYQTENLEFLANGAKKTGHALDVILMEGTYGSIAQDKTAAHMDAALLCEQLSAFRTCGALDDHTLVYITHINQVQTYSHAEYQAYLDLHAPAHVTVAYDGMRI